MAQIIEFRIPGRARGAYNANFPLGVEFVGAIDDGNDAIVIYYQNDQSETREKNRNLEIWANIDLMNDDGRKYIGILSNGFTVWEHTENTVPDDQVP